MLQQGKTQKISVYNFLILINNMPAESCKVLKGRCVGMDMYQLNWNAVFIMLRNNRIA